MAEAKKAKPKDNPKKWWQWLLVYPAIVGMFLNTVIPPAIDYFKDKTKPDKQVIKTEQAKLNKLLWKDQISCYEKVEPAVYFNQDFNANFVMRMCPNLYALVKIEAAETSFFKSGYKWVDFSDFAKKQLGSSIDYESLYNFIVTPLYAFSRSHNLTQYKKNQYFKTRKRKYNKPLCRDLKGKYIYEIKKVRKRCYLHITDTETGLEYLRKPVHCKRGCENLKQL